MMDFKHTNEPIADIGFAVADTLQSLAEKYFPDLSHFFPFQHSFNAEGEIIDNLIIVRVKSVNRIGAVPAFGKFTTTESNYIKKKAFRYSS